MKHKLLFLFIISTILIILIYSHYYKKNIEVLSINTLSLNNNFNPYLSSYFTSSNINYNFNIDFSNESLEIENLIALINNNERNIQQYIHKSNVIIISIGNNDYISEKLSIITNELKELFNLLRKYNNEEIIYISPTNIRNTIDIKKLCIKNKITFINGRSFINNPSSLSKIIYNKIENTWNKEKY